MELDFSDKIIRDFMIIWATIDPIGTLALFSSLTHSFTPQKIRETALKATIYSAIILLLSILIGQIILSYMGIQLISLRVSGGIILFLFGLQMIFSHNTSANSVKEPEHDIAVFPLAIPSIASPGAIMSVIVLTDNYTFDIQTQLCTAGILLTILTITCCLMLLATPILKVIGKNGSTIIIKIMGLILAALSIEIIMEALNMPEWVNSIAK